MFPAPNPPHLRRRGRARRPRYRVRKAAATPVPQTPILGGLSRELIASIATALPHANSSSLQRRERAAGKIIPIFLGINGAEPSLLRWRIFDEGYELRQSRSATCSPNRRRRIGTTQVRV